MVVLFFNIFDVVGRNMTNFKGLVLGRNRAPIILLVRFMMIVFLFVGIPK